MERQNIGFVSGMRGDLAVVSHAFDDVARSLKLCLPEKYSNVIECYSTTVEIQQFFNTRSHGKERHTLYLHFYFDKAREANEISDMTHLVDSFRLRLKDGEVPNSSIFRRFFKPLENEVKTQNLLEHYLFDHQEWAEFLKSAGFFVVGSNEIKDSVKALTIYRQKDTVEKAFNNYKDKYGGRRIRCQESALGGKVFIVYLSLCLRLILQKRLADANMAPLDTPRVLAQLNSLMKYRYEFSGRTKWIWERLPKRFLDLMGKLKIETPAQISW